MLAKLPLALGALLAVSAAVAAEPALSTTCAYAFDVTRAEEPAPTGCPVAAWTGGGYDVPGMVAILSPEDDPLRTSRPVPERIQRLVARFLEAP